MATKQLYFRGAEVRQWNGKVKEGILTQRVRIACDVTRTIAEHFGWDDLLFAGERELRSGAEKIPLKGQASIESIRLEPDGLKQHRIDVLATEARDFEVSFRAGEDEDDPPEAEMRFTVVLAESASIAQVEQYARVVGNAKARLTMRVVGDKQMKLGEDVDAEEPEAEAAEPVKEAPLASVTSMGERSRPRARTVTLRADPFSSDPGVQ